jgi:hypothetical protein
MTTMMTTKTTKPTKTKRAKASKAKRSTQVPADTMDAAVESPAAPVTPEAETAPVDLQPVPVARLENDEAAKLGRQAIFYIRREQRRGWTATESEWSAVVLLVRQAWRAALSSDGVA